MTRAMKAVVRPWGSYVSRPAWRWRRRRRRRSQTKAFEVVAVDGNLLVVNLPEGTREITVPAGFRFTVNGQQLTVQPVEAGHERDGDHHDENDSDTGHRHRGEERHGHAVDRLFHHREDRGPGEDVHARRRGQARREDHARRPARADFGFPSRRSADGDDHHVAAAARHDREGSAGDSRETKAGAPRVGQASSGAAANKTQSSQSAAQTQNQGLPSAGAAESCRRPPARGRSRARERPVARDGMRAEFRPPLRSLRGSRPGPRSCSDERGLLNLSSG